MKQNNIIVIDDDEDDCEFFKNSCSELNVKNEVLIFHSSMQALEYLQSMDHQPFFIVCDVNMPRLNGLELRQKINEIEELRLRAMPFLFWSTSGSENLINKAYSLHVQGFFKKPTSIQEMKQIVAAIMSYWDLSYHPLA